MESPITQLRGTLAADQFLGGDQSGVNPGKGFDLAALRGGAS